MISSLTKREAIIVSFGFLSFPFIEGVVNEVVGNPFWNLPCCRERMAPLVRLVWELIYACFLPQQSQPLGTGCLEGVPGAALTSICAQIVVWIVCRT